MYKRVFTISFLMGALAVALGAFGAHGLKALIAPENIATFETGVRYQFYHSFAMIIAAMLAFWLQETRFLRAAWSFLIGIVLFSGSLYLLACRDVLPFSVTWSGPITPIGGVFFIYGWVYMAWLCYKNNFFEKK